MITRVLKRTIRLSSAHFFETRNPSNTMSRKTATLSMKAKIRPYEIFPAASQEFVRSEIQEKSLNARINVQACRGNAQFRKRDQSPRLEYWSIHTHFIKTNHKCCKGCFRLRTGMRIEHRRPYVCSARIISKFFLSCSLVCTLFDFIHKPQLIHQAVFSDCCLHTT